MLLLPGNVAISSASISAVEPTTKRVEDGNIYRLASETGIEPSPYGKGEVVIGPDYEENGISYSGPVLCKWWKKNIDRREWESSYAKANFYYRIDDTDSSVWVAMYLPIEKNSVMSNALVECTAEEQIYLNRQRNGWA